MFLPGCDILLLDIEKERLDNSKIIEKGIYDTGKRIGSAGYLKTIELVQDNRKLKTIEIV